MILLLMIFFCFKKKNKAEIVLSPGGAYFLQTGPNQFVENQKQNQDYIPVFRILELKKNDKIKA